MRSNYIVKSAFWTVGRYRIEALKMLHPIDCFLESRRFIGTIHRFPKDRFSL